MKVSERMGASVSRKVNVTKEVWEKGLRREWGQGVSDRVVTTCAVMGDYSSV